MNILEENPHLSQVIEWDESILPQYRIVLNPHGERILPGHWGRNCNSILADFYWKILDVKPNDFIITPELPPIELKEKLEGETRPIAILHTTGGDPEFRTYLYMPDVAKYLKDKYLTIQVGGLNDAPADVELDLRGKLTYRQTAFVMNMASLSVNVDSFISHLSGALGISQITLFGSGNAVVTRPLQIKGESICLIPDYIRDCPGLGPCSASVRNCAATCTGVHNPKYIIEQIQSLEERNLVRRNYANNMPGSYSLKYVQ
jgi:ADP-heptose:LPS heptosyltransferase